MLVLAIVALEVPLIISLRDRVDNEVKSDARTQAAFLAATIDAERPPRGSRAWSASPRTGCAAA